MSEIDFDKVSTQVHKEVDALNRLIEEAIYHGGDSGGPYLCNKDDLEKAIKNYLDVTGLDYVTDVYWKNEDDPLLIVNKKELLCQGCVRNYLEARGII